MAIVQRFLCPDPGKQRQANGVKEQHQVGKPLYQAEKWKVDPAAIMATTKYGQFVNPEGGIAPVQRSRIIPPPQATTKAMAQISNKSRLCFLAAVALLKAKAKVLAGSRTKYRECYFSMLNPRNLKEAKWRQTSFSANQILISAFT
jgi:hypothetical protein